MLTLMSILQVQKLSNHNEAEEWVCLNYEGLAMIIFKVHTKEKKNNPEQS